MIRLIDKHEDILRNDKNRYYPPLLKEEIINKVLIYQQSINQQHWNMDYHQMVFYITGLDVIKKMDML